MTAAWLKNLGPITVCGDSTALGETGGTGGWKAGLRTSLTSAGYHHSFVGPYGAAPLQCYAVASTAISDFRDAGTYPLSTQLAAQRSGMLILHLGWNDVRSAWPGGITEATLQARMIALLDEVFAATPWMRVVLSRLLLCKAGDPGGWPSNDLAACNAMIASYNTGSVGLNGIVANYPTKRIVVAGGYSDPVRSDNIHPVDGATGYDLMYPPILTAIQNLKAA